MRTEISLTIAFIIGLIIKLMHWPGGAFIMVISLCSLMLVYLCGFYFFRERKTKKHVLGLSIVSGVLFSIIPIGVLFKFQHWPGAGFNLLLGTTGALIMTVVMIIMSQKAEPELAPYFRKMIRRGAILTVLSASLYLLPAATLIKIQYRDDPEMVRLKTLYYAHPENAEYKLQHDAYMKAKKDEYLEETDGAEQPDD